MKMERVYIGLGSNLCDPVSQVMTVISEIALLKDTQMTAQSSLYRSPPWGGLEQPDYINAVVQVCTTLSPLALLEDLLQIENNHKRVRDKKWGPRTLDCDILLFGKKQIKLPNLEIPHPRLCERAFVVIPLSQIAPDLILPDGTTLKACVNSLGRYSLTELTELEMEPIA